MSPSTPRWLDAEERRAWIAYMASSTLLEDYLDRQLRRDVGITHADYSLLARLSNSPDQALGMSELAEQMKITRSRLTHAVTRLENAGYVERREHPTDRRGQLAALAPAGRELLERAAPDHVEAVRHAVFDALTPDQVRQWGEISASIYAAIEGVTSDPLPWHRR
ncbi:MarR family transcriptional regulator [Actinospica sp.]|jgi:DNA-binding MarR family transcriptional regulator|uniref:MarR family winged helix-turn-helix transcriptional regulator n=1 Tax=Actinospica sp. TaxID=1872142 RepID=UPI002CA084EC|nr:MarR family transcriptional regulator [Actinospica sp.]HWG23964.1 MarR family transcriptional regulator [Actinospica sp.]